MCFLRADLYLFVFNLGYEKTRILVPRAQGVNHLVYCFTGSSWYSDLGYEGALIDSAVGRCKKWLKACVSEESESKSSSWPFKPYLNVC